MSTTQIKAKPTAQPVNAREHLVQVVQELAATRKLLDQAENEHQATGEELAVLLARGKSSEKESFDLQAKRAEALHVVKLARADLARSIGKPAEETYAEKLAEAEGLAAKVETEINEFDRRTQRSSTLTRIAELRNQRELSVQSVQELQRRARELSNTHEQALLARSDEAMKSLLVCFQDLLAVCEQHGALIASLRLTDGPALNRLLNLLALDQQDWLLLLTPVESSDGKNAAWRGPLYERQAEVKEQLRKLSAQSNNGVKG